MKNYYNQLEEDIDNCIVELNRYNKMLTILKYLDISMIPYQLFWGIKLFSQEAFWGSAFSLAFIVYFSFALYGVIKKIKRNSLLIKKLEEEKIKLENDIQNNTAPGIN